MDLGTYRINRLKDHPKDGWHYVLGGDASGGTGNDEAAIQILALETFEQVLEWGDNRVDPVEFGHLIVKLGTQYNTCHLIVEGNNHGIATHSILLKSYPRSKIYKRKIPMKQGKVAYGFYTGESTKKELVGNILMAIEAGLYLYGEETCDEMNKFEEHQGKMGAPQDGKVIALGLACLGYFKWKHLAVSLNPPKPKEQIDYERHIFQFDAYEWMQEAAKRDRRGLFKNQLN